MGNLLMSLKTVQISLILFGNFLLKKSQTHLAPAHLELSKVSPVLVRKDFVFTPGWKWNVFDLFIVILALVHHPAIKGLIGKALTFFAEFC